MLEVLRHVGHAVVRSGAIAAGALALLVAQPAAPRAETLTIAVSGAIVTLDPHLSALVQTDLSAASHLYSTLTVRDADMKVRGDLAESWTAIDDRTWSFKLRPGVKFANGEVLDAAAVKWNIERVLDPQTRSRNKIWFDPIGEMQVVSPTEIKLVTKAPYPVLPAQLTMMFLMPPKWTLTNKPATEAMGTGPYDLKEFRPGDRLVFTARKDYYGPKPAFDEVVIRMIPEPSVRVAAIMAGEVDFAIDLPPRDITRINASPRAKAGWGESGRMMMVRFNNLQPPFKDNKLLRQAVGYAIDRQAIINAVYEGQSSVSHCQIISSMYFGFNPDLPASPYDPAKAKQLIAQSGVRTPIETVLDIPLGRYLLSQEIGQIIAAQLEEVGIKVQIRELEFGAWINRYQQNQMAPLTLMGQGWPTLDADGMLALHDAANPVAYWNDAKFGELLAKGRSTTNEAQRLVIYKEATKHMCDESPVTSLFGQPLIYATSKRATWKVRGDDWVRAQDFERN